MAFSTPRLEAIAEASKASTSVIRSVKTSEAHTFWPTTLDDRSDSRNVPVWMAVPSRLPRAPKIFPGSAMAAGTNSNRPGNSANRSWLRPSTTPATTLVTARMHNAPSDWRTPRGSGPSSHTRGRRNCAWRTPERPKSLMAGLDGVMVL